MYTNRDINTNTTIAIHINRNMSIQLSIRISINIYYVERYKHTSISTIIVISRRIHVNMKLFF